MTAAVGLYLEMKLPPPWNPTLEPTPLLVYGGSGSVGAFAIKLARASNIHPIIAVAGGGASFVETLIDRSKGDTIVDYRKGDESLISQIKEALKKSGHEEIKYAYDGVSEKGSYDNISQILAKDAGSQFVVVLPPKADNKIDKSIKWGFSNVGRVHKGVDPESPEGKAGIKLGGRDFGYVYYRVFARALADGWLTAHPYEVIPGGLNGVETGIRNLAGFKNSAKKYVYRIAETSASSSL
jgi:NADPH2:quinone reductase